LRTWLKRCNHNTATTKHDGQQCGGRITVHKMHPTLLPVFNNIAEEYPMRNFITITLKGIFRDRVFHGIMVIAVAFLFIPSLASLSMRQVTELSITLCLSLVSFILLLLAMFLAGTSIWKDMERRYIFSVISLPMDRSSYVLGKFLSTALFLMITSVILGFVSYLVILNAINLYPPVRPVVWGNLFAALCFNCMKYILLSSFAFLFSSVSTSFFLPVFGAISVFMVGSVSQDAYDFIHSSAGAQLAPLTQKAATLLYYILPNFGAFNLNLNAIYGVPLALKPLSLTVLYFVIYLAIILTATIIIFGRREMK
jgi:Cu-processing system permease protein